MCVLRRSVGLGEVDEYPQSQEEIINPALIQELNTTKHTHTNVMTLLFPVFEVCVSPSFYQPTNKTNQEYTHIPIILLSRFDFKVTEVDQITLSDVSSCCCSVHSS